MPLTRLATSTLTLLLALFTPSLHAMGLYLGGNYGLNQYDGDSAGLVKDDSDIAWQGFLGYRFNPHFALQGGYLDLGRVTLHANNKAIDSLDTTAGQLAAVGILPIKGGVEIYAKLAVNGLATDAISNGSEAGEDNRVTPGAGAGLSYRLGWLGLRVEYEYVSDINDMLDLQMLSAGVTLNF